MSSPFDDALESVEQLGELYEPAAQRAWDKDIGRIDDVVRALIAASPLVVVSSHDGAGHADASPRGGQPGFVTVLDDHHLAIPDATGNKRLDTLNNIISTGHAALLFLIPGRDQTLRVNGRACVTSSPSVLERVESVGKPPRTAIVVRAKRLDLSRRYRETLSATQIGKLLGVDGKTVTREILQGDLKAEKRPTNRLNQQGGDPWSVTPADLRSYILEHLERIDLRKVEKFAFVQIVAGEPLDAAGKGRQ